MPQIGDGEAWRGEVSRPPPTAGSTWFRHHGHDALREVWLDVLACRTAPRAWPCSVLLTRDSPKFLPVKLLKSQSGGKSRMS